MTNINNPPAFPLQDTDYVQGQTGMSMRDYFASAALTGLLAAKPEVIDEKFSLEQSCAEDAYRLADAMLKAREL